MSKGSLQINGMRVVKSKLRKFDEETRQAVRAEVGRAAMSVQGNARRNAPVNDGRYRSSIAWGYVDDSTAEVGSNTTYAPFLEFGTGPAGKRGPHSAAAQLAMSELGYEHGPHGGYPPLEILERWAAKNGIPYWEVPAIQWAIFVNGSPPRPHLIPALEAERPKFQKNMRNLVEAKVRDAGR